MGPGNKHLLRLEDTPRNPTVVMSTMPLPTIRRQRNDTQSLTQLGLLKLRLRCRGFGRGWCGGWGTHRWHPLVSGKHIPSATFLASCSTCRPFPTIPLALEFGTWRGTVCHWGETLDWALSLTGGGDREVRELSAPRGVDLSSTSSLCPSWLPEHCFPVLVSEL